MFTEMRRKDRQITPTEAEQILKDGDYGVLSMLGTNGYPYAVPLNYAYIEKALETVKVIKISVEHIQGKSRRK